MEILDYLNMSPELQKNLTNLAKSNNLSMRELAQLCNMITIRETILQQHKSPITQNAKNKRWYTRLPDGKQIVKTKKRRLRASTHYILSARSKTTVSTTDTCTSRKLQNGRIPKISGQLYLENNISPMARIKAIRN